jgi:hydrogenase nickel incorporation protein HypA/HybF
VHELALAKGIVDQVLRVIEREQLGRVERVHLEVGTASGVDAEDLRFCFQVAAAGSAAQAAVLDIEMSPGGHALTLRSVDAEQRQEEPFT